jgi:hypothetical protein
VHKYIMLETENSHRNRRSAKLPDVGRPRIRPLDETAALSFKVSPELIRELDAEAARLTAERGPGASKVSRTEAVKVILAKWLAARADRSKRQ